MSSKIFTLTFEKKIPRPFIVIHAQKRKAIIFADKRKIRGNEKQVNKYKINKFYE